MYWNETEFEENANGCNYLDFHADTSTDSQIYGDGQQFWRHDGDPDQYSLAYWNTKPMEDDIPKPNVNNENAKKTTQIIRY